MSELNNMMQISRKRKGKGRTYQERGFRLDSFGVLATTINGCKGRYLCEIVI
ncbi:hypothetical protein WN55_10052 [Dufourea novaeangliae]|uniref:Uncharacterized protein n=1 Tax=Dufourea novaeangliae TaxID=178035 RepID=A0A154P8K9_DUFNO|nr:hypothetical protein WN55_10052 [Dufourea novaeangliae]